MFHIFKWELIDGIELIFQPMPTFENAYKDSFLDIEVNPISFTDRWTKKYLMFTPQQENLHIIKTCREIEQSSTGKASLKCKGTITTLGK